MDPVGLIGSHIVCVEWHSVHYLCNVHHFVFIFNTVFLLSHCHCNCMLIEMFCVFILDLVSYFINRLQKEG